LFDKTWFQAQYVAKSHFMKNSLSLLLLTWYCILGLSPCAKAQNKDFYEEIDFWQSAMITKIETLPDEGLLYKASFNNTYNGREIYLYLNDSDLDNICLGDTIFIHTVTHSGKEKHCVVYTWEMLHHHDCEMLYTPEKEEVITELGNDNYVFKKCVKLKKK
jgi:hypothetical protein